MGLTTLERYYEVDYDDHRHLYYYKDPNNRYLSATQIISKFKNKFDPVEKSIEMAERHGETPEYWQKKWKDKTNKSLDRGNNLHDHKEDFLLSRGFDTVDGRHYRVYNRNLFPVHVPYIQLPDGVYPELKLWRHDYRIAGRSDKIILRTNPKLEGWAWEQFCDKYIYPVPVKPKCYRYMDIEDYKTNQQIRKESFYTRGENGEKVYKMMLGPLAHLMDCEWIHYCLQFSLYQFMGEYHGFLPGKRRLIFYPNYETLYEGLLADLPGGDLPIVEELPYLREEVIAMLNHERA